MDQPGDLAVGVERHLDLGARADERMAVDDEAVADMGVEQGSPPLLFGPVGVDGDGDEFGVAHHGARRSRSQPSAFEGVRGGLQRLILGERPCRSSAA